MTDDDIERVANELLEGHGLDSSLPVDPLHIAREEEILLVPGSFDNCFDGRIEYCRRGGVGRFYLYYAEEELPFRPAGRVRFSIAHELGHFYLPEHRQYLLSGEWHSSFSDSTSKKQREREADRFAACLLMPRELFKDEVSAQSDGVCTLQDLCRLASDVFNTSLTSTIFRYIELSFEPCCMVICEGGRIVTSGTSEDLRMRGVGRVSWGGTVPPQSVTSRAKIAKLSGSMPRTSGYIDSSVWFDGQRSYRMWEEVLLISGAGRTITFLTLQDRDGV